MIKRLLIGLLIRLLDSSAKIDYKQIDRKAVEDWAWQSFENKGFKSYLGYEDLRILKEMSFGKERDQYMILVGRRLQLLYLADEMRKAFENKRSEEEKKKSEQQKQNA